MRKTQRKAEIPQTIVSMKMVSLVVMEMSAPMASAPSCSSSAVPALNSTASPSPYTASTPNCHLSESLGQPFFLRSTPTATLTLSSNEHQGNSLRGPC